MTDSSLERRGTPNPDPSPESLAELLELPLEQRQLMVWLLRQNTVSFAAIAAQMAQPEPTVRSQLSTLIQRGLVQVVGEDTYQAYAPQRRPQTLSDSLLQTLTPNHPLSVILSSAGRDLVSPGNPFELGVTVTNRGSRSAVIHVYIDDMAPVLRTWCQTSQGALALAPGQSGEVLFTFAVPVEVMPGIFNYLVVVDAPEHYGEFPPGRYPQQIQVLPTIQDRSQTADPTFVVSPPSNTQTPLPVIPGGILPFQIQIFNRSERVDRFRLTCLDLPPDWVRFEYPQDAEGLGLVAQAHSLGLNPGDQGVVLLTLSPPVDALAGTYTPTLKLLSENNPDLALLDLIYLQVQPVYQLQPELITLVNQARTNPARFQLLLTNQGNSPRTVTVAVRGLDAPDLCDYTLEADAVLLAPHQTRQVGITAQPAKPRRRPWLGAGRLLNFQIELADAEAHPLPLNRFQGYFTWMPRPWWQLLLVILAGLGVLATLIWLIWWLFFRPPVVPQVVTFFVEDERYSAAKGHRAHVGWQIRHPRRLQTLRLTGLTPDGAILSGPLEYDLSGPDLPRELAPFCTLEARLLSCRNVYTDARLPGEYIFELTLIPKRGRGEIPPARTNVTVIEPIPIPTVVELLPEQSQYTEAGTPVDLENLQSIPPITEGGIRLTWAITAPENLRGLRLIAQTQNGAQLALGDFGFRDPETGALLIPDALQPFCTLNPGVLFCQQVPTNIVDVGEYTFTLTAVPGIAEDGLELEPKVTDPVKILPRPVRLQALFLNRQLVPLEVGKIAFPLGRGQMQPVQLAWTVEGGSTAQVELLPSPGQVELSGSALFEISQESGPLTLTLQFSNGVGDPIVRSLTIEPYDPNPTDPVETAAEAAAAAAAAASGGGGNQAGGGGGQAGGGGGGEEGPPPLDQAAPTDPGRLSPSETPPQFD
jgi:hypothetical protein